MKKCEEELYMAWHPIFYFDPDCWASNRLHIMILVKQKYGDELILGHKYEWRKVKILEID